MPRFYISDGNKPGARVPRVDFRTKSGRQSDILNEAQAITRMRKLAVTKPQYATYRYWMFFIESSTALGGGPTTVFNEIQMVDWDNVNRALGVIPTISRNEHPGSDAAAIVNGAVASSTTVNTFGGFNSGDLYNCNFLWDFGTNRRIKQINVYVPAFGSYTYAPGWFSIRAGTTPACEDFSSGLLYHGAQNLTTHNIQ
jgi:hypothetical protein